MIEITGKVIVELGEEPIIDVEGFDIWDWFACRQGDTVRVKLEVVKDGED